MGKALYSDSESNELIFFKHVEDQSVRSETLAIIQPPAGTGGPRLGDPGEQRQVLCSLAEPACDKTGVRADWRRPGLQAACKKKEFRTIVIKLVTGNWGVGEG